MHVLVHGTTSVGNGRIWDIKGQNTYNASFKSVAADEETFPRLERKMLIHLTRSSES